MYFVQEDLFHIGGDISGSPTGYIVHAFNPVSNSSFESTLDLISCGEGSGCQIEIPGFLCPEATTIAITIAAVNKLGVGPYSNPFTIGKTMH